MTTKRIEFAPSGALVAVALVLGWGGTACLEAREGSAEAQGHEDAGAEHELGRPSADTQGDAGTDTTSSDAAPSDTGPSDTGPATPAGPIAVIDEGAHTGTTEVTVEPQTLLRLDGSQSRDAVSFAWRVASAPTGSVSTFRPSASVASPIFEVNIAGTYVFELVVTDADGQRSAPVYFTARVVSSAGLHIELIWRTPLDPDESDEGGDQIYQSAGSDVDLHLKVGGDAFNWFDRDHDCFWSAPNYPFAGGDAGPGLIRLDRDDTDGGGPENINVDEPAPGIYDIGVHYWDDWGYGAALATVRIYLDGELAAEWSEVELKHHDLWRPFRIAYPEGTITELFSPDGGPNLYPSYPIPPGL